MFHFKPIGFIQSIYPDKFGVPRQSLLAPSAKATLTILPQVIAPESLQGLSEFSHVWLIFVFHANANKHNLAKIAPPRLEGKKVGVFASRSPHRPNPIGLSCARLDEIRDNTLYLSGVDLLSGTPVLDIKPYVPLVDKINSATGGWTDTVPVKIFPVHFTDEALSCIEQLRQEDPQLSLLQVQITETLQHDPRPVENREGIGSLQKDVFYIRILNVDIEFAFISQQQPLEAFFKVIRVWKVADK